MSRTHAIQNVVERELRTGRFGSTELKNANVPELTAQVSLLFPKPTVERVINNLMNRQ